ncbi:unnamed protein product [Prorocentrum cordatum]|uniref:Uncharacterized protein n=1 Tax=Prorocentrum cordatum TaxID=2364126 RepID=A0ABN9WNK6_9DINO|nr:unnamed protein product [Polarella glacialis]
MWPSSLLHFLLVELRVAYAFYFSMMNLITTIATQVALSYKQVDSYPPEFLHGSAAAMAECNAVGVHQAVHSLNLAFTASSNCIDFSQHPSNYFGYGSLTTQAITAFLCFSALFLYLRDGGSWSFSSGAYVSFTYHLEQHLMYKIAGKLVVWWVIVGFVSMAYMFHAHLVGGSTGMAFVRQYWLPSLGLLFSAHSLTVQEPILFCHDSDRFKELTFHRPWYTVLFQSNDAFAVKIQNAMLMDLRSQERPPPELSNLMPDADPDQILGLLANDEGQLGGYEQIFSE